MVTITGFLFGAGLIVLGGAPTFETAAIVLAAIGAMSLAFQTTINSMLLSLSAFEYHGRIQSLVMLGFSGFGIAALPLGVLADAIDMRATFVLMGAVILGSMLLFASRHGRHRAREIALDLG